MVVDIARRMFMIALVATLVACAGLGSRPAPPSIEQVLQMVRDKVETAEIIRRMQESGAIYRFSGSELARLHDQGVPDPVIDYMQATLLDSVRREEALRAFSGTHWPDPAYMRGGSGRGYWFP